MTTALVTEERLSLGVPYFKQDSGHTCGPASLQMVLAYYDIRESEEKLADELETNEEIGTRHGRMIEVTTKYGLYCYANEDAPYLEIPYIISQKAPVIIHYKEMSSGIGHYSVVVGFDEHSIYLNDPWNGKDLSIAHDEFQERWMCGPEGVCKKWLLGIARFPFQIGRQYMP